MRKERAKRSFIEEMGHLGYSSMLQDAKRAIETLGDDLTGSSEHEASHHSLVCYSEYISLIEK